MPFMLSAPPVLPCLKHRHGLPDHFRACVGMLEEFGWCRDGEFEQGFRQRAMALLVGSLATDSDVHEYASGLVVDTTLKTFQASLVEAFANRFLLREELARQTKLLKLTCPSGKFLYDCKKLYILHKRVRGDSESSYMELVRRIVGLLPRGMIPRIIRTMSAIAPHHWELALPFGDDVATADSGTFLGTLVEMLRCHDLVREFEVDHPPPRDHARQVSPGPETRDHARQVSPGPSGAAAAQATNWMEPWAMRFECVKFCYGAGFVDELNKIRDRLGEGVEIKIVERGVRRPYGLLGLHKGVRCPTLNCGNRDFVYSKN